MKEYTKEDLKELIDMIRRMSINEFSVLTSDEVITEFNELKEDLSNISLTLDYP